MKEQGGMWQLCVVFSAEALPENILLEYLKCDISGDKCDRKEDPSNFCGIMVVECKGTEHCL